mgnify:CR=1 FL=1
MSDPQIPSTEYPPRNAVTVELRRLGVPATLFLAALTTGNLRLVARGAERPLNLLIIQTDEHHFGTLGCYGGKMSPSCAVLLERRSGCAP